MTLLRAVPIAVLLLAGLAGPAGAQIYSWRDANGTIFYSDHPPEDVARTFRVLGTPFRSSRPAVKGYRNSYDSIIARHAATYAVPVDLVRAVVQVESGFNPRAVSSEGAMGLMQLMPGTAIEMGVRNPFDPDENIRGGVAYLRQLLNRYGGDQRLALAAYNAGPEAVRKYGDRVPPYAETQRYVSLVRNRSGYGQLAFPQVTGKRAATSRGSGKRAPAVAHVEQPAHVVYKWWEKTADGRRIQKFSDTRPATGDYEIVR